MKIDAGAAEESPGEVQGLARKAEEFGFDCFWVSETRHDPFVLLAVAAGATKSISIGSSIALAFTRSPTAIAYAAWDLQALSEGRLILGLGSQVKGHIERRFGMKWEAPAAKMRETILAMRAVWDTWQTGAKLDFRGRFYRLDLMTPFFSPGAIANPKIPVLVASVNPGMAMMAGATADGIHVHPLHTVRYLREAVMPAVEEGLAKSKRTRSDFSVAASVFAAVGESREEIESVRQVYRQQVAFYASTRTYRGLMELHGWGDVCDRLHEHSVRGEWGKMEGEVSDDMLDAFVVNGTWEDLGREMVRRYDGLVDRVRVYLPFDGDPKWKKMVEGFRAGR